MEGIMKRIALLTVFVFLVLVSFGQAETKKTVKKVTDPPKRETIKTVPKTTTKQAQIKKAQLKKAQMHRNKKQVVRKVKAIKRRRNR
jgi:hypothetical protein